MKKYELIKEYPGSPTLGTILRQWKSTDGNNKIFYGSQYTLSPALSPEIVESYSEFWQEIVEKDYEILSIRTDDGTPSDMFENDKFMWSTDDEPKYESLKTITERWKKLKVKIHIHSVKRLSDNQIFTVGDDILEQGEHSKIEYFELRGDDLAIRINHQVTKGSSTILISSKFEKYIPKEYEILSLKCKIKILTDTPVEVGQIVNAKIIDGIIKWEYKPRFWDGYPRSCGEDSLKLTLRSFDIYSIKRLSDGEVFTIGDKVKFMNWSDYLSIDKFTISSNILYFHIKDTKYTCDYSNWGNFIKAKNPLFKTEDGVDIFEGDDIHCVGLIHYRYYNAKATTTNFKTYHNLNNKCFSTKEIAEEYILRYKPCLSVMDVHNIMYNQGLKSGYDCDIDMTDYIELVKSRL